MPRYFLEVQYKGTNYKGFQAQPNAKTIQGEIEKALYIFLKNKINLTTSSRTDAGVHAKQNFFHFDIEEEISDNILYNLNAILPKDIVLKNLLKVAPHQHSRFDAVSRSYQYYVYQNKNPFLTETAYYYPFKLNFGKLSEAANVLFGYNDFTSFSKRNTDVHTFNCEIKKSFWTQENNCFVYHVEANRFLRGMVRALVATMLKVGREIILIEEFKKIIEAKDCTKADFSAPAHGLFLMNVNYPFLGMNL